MCPGDRQGAASDTSHVFERGRAMATYSRSKRRAIARADRDRPTAVGDDQHIATQVEQARELVPPPTASRVRVRATDDKRLATRLTPETRTAPPILRVDDCQGAVAAGKS